MRADTADVMARFAATSSGSGEGSTALATWNESCFAAARRLMPSPAYVSHEVVLEPALWQVHVGGRVFTPEPKVFELLHYLMRNRGRLVSKQELLDSLWAGHVVTESVLTRCMSCARKLLGDDPRSPKFIRTLHGRGYEFMPAVTERPATEPGATSSDRQTSEPKFVGREHELAILRAALTEIASLRRRVMLITGEAGIGKTRLLAELGGRAPQGIDVHWGRAASGEGAPALFAWRQCFRSIIGQRSTKTVMRAFGEADGSARKLVFGTDRELAAALSALDSAQARFRAFDAVAHGLSALARQRPLVLVLDDLHAADLPSLLLLDVVRQTVSAPLLVLGAIRDGELEADGARSQVLARIRSSCQPELDLRGLKREQVSAFIEDYPVSERELAVERLMARTAGNPLFLSLLVPSDLDPAERGPLSTAVRQAVSVRLSALSRECVALLRLGAVVGREFDVSLLARAAGQPPERTAAFLARACEDRLLKCCARSRYAFVHDLAREVLYDELDPDERQRAHFAVGSAMQEAGTARHLGAGEELAAVALSITPAPLSVQNGVYDPLLVGLLS